MLHPLKSSFSKIWIMGITYYTSYISNEEIFQLAPRRSASSRGGAPERSSTGDEWHIARVFQHNSCLGHSFESLGWSGQSLEISFESLGYSEQSVEIGAWRQWEGYQGAFICTACNQYGYGFAFRCDRCSFNFHGSCSRAPKRIAHRSHPLHELVLRKEGLRWLADRSRPPQQSSHPPQEYLARRVEPERACKVCEREVSGDLYYACSAGCPVKVYISCAYLPTEIKHAWHPQHMLKLVPTPNTPPKCRILNRSCFRTSMSYRCQQCPDFFLHTSCAALPFDLFEETRLAMMGLR